MHGKLSDEIKKLDEEQKEIAKKLFILRNKSEVIKNKANEKLRKLSAIENELLTKIVQVTLFKNHNNINFYSYHNSSGNIQFSLNDTYIHSLFNVDKSGSLRNGNNSYDLINDVFINCNTIDSYTYKIIEFSKQIYKNHSSYRKYMDNLIWRLKTTDMCDNYERAIQFLLCTLSRPPNHTSASSPFPKDISKLIANKILFFIERKN